MAIDQRTRRLRQRLDRAKRAGRERADFSRYQDDPCGYCRDVLRVRLTPTQERIARLLVTPPFKVMVKAGHNVGKSFLAACLVNWWYDCFDPSVCLTTAPTDRQVRDILWKEIRTVRGGRGGFPGPKIARLESRPDHFAHGFTARDGDRFQGHHADNVLIVFDEAVGVDPIFWEAAQTMLQGKRYGFLAFYNPTNQGSQAFVEERRPDCHVVTMSTLDHPNVEAELAGLPPPYPSAVRLGRLREMLNAWATRLPAREVHDVGDVCLGGDWYKPGPIAESRLLGRWPTQAINSVWSEAVFDLAERTLLPDTGPLQIGCDVARYGDDYTVIHARKGGVSLSHEAHNGWSLGQTYERIVELVDELARQYKVKPRRVPVAIDDAGVGGGLTDFGQRDGYMFVPVNAAFASPDPDSYPNMRSALWFGVAGEAKKGNLSLAKLPEQARMDLRRELLAPTYGIDVRGRRVVEPKDLTKERLGRSPDNADGFNLAFANLTIMPERVAGRIKVA